MSQPESLANAGPTEDARLQAEEYDSLFASSPLKLNNGESVMVPLHPSFGMLDDDRTEDYEDLLMEIETYDRAPDIYIPETKLDDGAIVPSETIKGDLLRPYRVDGVRVRPAHSVKVVQAALGLDAYQKLRDGGKSAADVWKIWGKQGLEIQARSQGDSKSVGGDVVVEAVSATNS